MLAHLGEIGGVPVGADDQRAVELEPCQRDAVSRAGRLGLSSLVNSEDTSSQYMGGALHPTGCRAVALSWDNS